MKILTINSTKEDTKNKSDYEKLIPISSDGLLKIYKVNYDYEIKEALNNIKENYSTLVKETKINAVTYSNENMPDFLINGENKLFDIINYIEEVIEESTVYNGQPIYGGNKRSDVLAELNYYPLLYIILKNLLQSESKYIDLKNITDYLIKLNGEDYIIEDNRLEKGEAVLFSFNDCIPLDNISDKEFHTNFGTIIEELNKVLEYIDFTICSKRDVEDYDIIKDLPDEFNKKEIENLLSLGIDNAKCIDKLNEFKDIKIKFKAND